MTKQRAEKSFQPPVNGWIIRQKRIHSAIRRRIIQIPAGLNRWNVENRLLRFKRAVVTQLLIKACPLNGQDKHFLFGRQENNIAVLGFSNNRVAADGFVINANARQKRFIIAVCWTRRQCYLQLGIWRIGRTDQILRRKTVFNRPLSGR